jgi:hypothetical protein
VPVEASVVREIHPPHSPTPDLAQQRVRPLYPGSRLGGLRRISRGSAEQIEEIARALVRVDERAELVRQLRVGARQKVQPCAPVAGVELDQLIEEELHPLPALAGHHWRE